MTSTMRRSAMALLLAHTAAHIQFERCCDKYEPTVAVARMLREDSSNGKGRGMSADPARWSKDPGGVHELRWWDGQHWTAYVADGGVPSIEAAKVAPWPPPIEERWSGSSYVIAGGFLVAMLLLAGAAIATNIPPIPACIPKHGRLLGLCLLAVLLIGAAGLVWYAWNAKKRGSNTTALTLIIVVLSLSTAAPAFWWLVTFNGDVGHC